MTKVQALRPAPAPIAPEREAWLVAVAERNRLAIAVASARGLVEDARQDKANADAALAQIREEVAAERARDGRKYAEAKAAARAWAPSTRLRQLRDAEAETMEYLHGAQAGLALLEPDLVKLQGELAQAEEQLATAADALAAAELSRLIDEARPLQARLIELRLAMRFVLATSTAWSRRDGLPPEVEAARKFLEDADMPPSPAMATMKDWDADPRLERWRSWRESLRRGIDEQAPK